MKHLKSQIKSMLLPIGLLGLSSCASYNPMVTDGGYTFGNKPDYGLVAFSMTCSGDWDTIVMTLADKNSTREVIPSSPPLVPIETPCDSQKHYFLLSLKKGAYYFDNIAPKMETNNMDRINFNSTLQRVTYLGAFYFLSTRDHHNFLESLVATTNGAMRVGLKNELQEDIQAFHRRYTNIPTSNYRFEKVTRGY